MSVSASSVYAHNLQALRAALKKQGLQGFLVPRADAWLGEYVAPDSERLRWLTGFTGSAGMACVLDETAAVFTDSRYTLQLAQEADSALFEAHDAAEKPLKEWLRATLPAGGVVGFDPWLHAPAFVAELSEALEGAGITLRAMDKNPIDALWQGRPPPPRSTVRLFPHDIAGLSSAQKRARLAADLRGQGLFAAVITQPESLAWLLNIRAQDTDYTPVALSYGFIEAAQGKVTWFIDAARVQGEVKNHLGAGVEIAEPRAMDLALGHLAARAQTAGQAILVDGKRSPLWFKNKLAAEGAALCEGKDPCVDPRAIKTQAEQQSIRSVHEEDGLAVTRALFRLAQEGVKGRLTETGVDALLQALRGESPDYRTPSFPTIAGFGPHGAIVHYRARRGQDARITAPGLLLLDSGGQYGGGTTDITRTVFVGEPGGAPAPEEWRQIYTLVLRGHIAVASAVVPEGTNGAAIDALARRALQARGFDYGHGTGHGVGCYLSVHEEAATLSPRGATALAPGMLLSNEPGYYRAGAFGMRLENLVFVQEAGHADAQGRALLCFDTVTLAPFDRALIVPGMLEDAEKEWLNAYHARVLAAIGPGLLAREGALALAWLQTQTAVF